VAHPITGGLTADDVADRAAITDLFVRYCTALRTKDVDLFDDVFAPDGVIDYSRLGGSRTGVAETKAWLAALLGGVEQFYLFVGNSEFEPAADRRSVRVTTTWQGLFVPRDGQPLQDYGYYEDLVVRRDEGWRIAERVDYPEALVVATLAPPLT